MDTPQHEQEFLSNHMADERPEQHRSLAEPFSWHAPEGMRPQRGTGWYVAFALTTVALMLVSIFLFKSWTFAILIPVMAAALLSLSFKPPQTINYAISPKGVYVADTLHDFSEFRGFGIIEDHGYFSAVLLPVKRFSPGLTLYFSEAEGEMVVDMLGARLPMQDMKPDMLEKLIRLMRL